MASDAPQLTRDMKRAIYMSKELRDMLANPVLCKAIEGILDGENDNARERHLEECSKHISFQEFLKVLEQVLDSAVPQKPYFLR